MAFAHLQGLFIQDPLASRCAKFRFKPLNMETQLSRIRTIQESEGVRCSDEVLNQLVTCSGGDLRQVRATACGQRKSAVPKIDDFVMLAGHYVAAVPSSIARR